MSKLKYSLVLGLLLGTLALSGQNNKGAALFPELTPDVRGVGMGNSGVASTVNAFSIYRNAAKTVFSTVQSELGYSFTPWMRDLTSGNNLHGVGGYYNIDKKQGVTAGFRWFKHADVNIGNDNTFTPKDWSVDVGYARKFTETLSLGLTARFVRSDMSATDEDAVANAFAVDLGIYYQPRRDNERWGWAVGLQASNFGTKIDYGHGKYDQPAKVSVGGMLDHSLNEKHRLQGTLDVGCRVIPDTSWESAVGVEYTGWNLLSVRGGYHYGEENNRMQRYGTLGCGLHIYHIRADFAYLLPETNSFLKNTWQVSLGLDLGLFIK